MTKRKQKPTGNVQELFRSGTAALNQGKIKEARSLLEQAYALDQTNGDVILNLAGSQILSKQFKQAITLLEPLTEQDPNNPMIWTNLGAAYLGNPILAKDTNPLDKDAKNLIAELSEKLQNPDGSALPASDQTDEE
jgi:Flp pilus assembly protein TadD